MDSENSNSGRSSHRNGGGKGDRSLPFFWTVPILLILLLIGLAFISESNFREEMTFGELVSGLTSGKLNKENVHELRIGEQYITFQDQPEDQRKKSLFWSGGSEQQVPATPGSTPQSAQHPEQPNPRKKRYYTYRGGISGEDVSKLTTLLSGRGIDWKGSGPQTEYGSIFLMLLTLGLCVLAFIMIRRMGGAGTAMSFGRSRGRLYADDDVKITFEDVAGIDDAVEELREIVEFLRTPGKYQSLGGRIPRGVLLVGPPGTGKTLLAKAVAGEAGVPFFSLSGSDFVELYVGVGAARVRDMFAQAGQRSPSIIFIDELDALGKTRGSGAPGGHDEREQTLNALLVEMDGFGSDQSVIVMAATNRPETLDPALLRPGRFDRHVLVDRPDYKGREAILKVHAQKIKMDDGVELARVARLTPGFVGADLANLVNEAALLAARKGKSAVTMADIEEGIERVIAGLEKTSRLIRDEEKKWTAYHESGHALVASSLPHADPVHKISIIPRGFALGYVLQHPEDDRMLMTQSELQARIAVMLGGMAAEELIYGETSAGVKNDLEQATDLARRMITEFGMSQKLGCVNYRETRSSPFLRGSVQGVAESTHSENTLREIDLEIRRLLDEGMQTAREVLRSRREALEHMARELIEKEVMSAEALKEILAQYKTGPQLVPGTSFKRMSTKDEAEAVDLVGRQNKAAAQE